MPEQKCALFLGAGFSVPAGIPTTPELSRQFLDVPEHGALPRDVEQDVSTHLRAFWEEIFGYREGGTQPSLESHFTIIDLAANTGHQLGPSYSPKKLRAVRRISIHRAFQILDSRLHFDDAIEQLFREGHTKLDLSVITSNWDIVVERHLPRVGLAYTYGPGVVDLNPANERGPITLHKLHGSANWVYCDSCRTLFSTPSIDGKGALHMGAYLEPDDFRALGSQREVIEQVEERIDGRRRCRLCSCPMSGRVGTFSYRKDYAIQQFQTIWHSAFADLRESQSWLFIGYSMPEADFEIRQILKSAELARFERVRPSITVVSKEPREGEDQVRARFSGFFGSSLIDYYGCGLSAWMERHFADWLRSQEKA